MQERHKDRNLYFEEQSVTSKKYVLPFIEQYMELTASTRVLEVGCGEGGNLKPFLDKGCLVTGVDILEGKIKNGKQFFENHKLKKNLHLVTADIYNPPDDMIKQYDLILMRDVLEHIHDQKKFMAYIKKFLKPSGLFFLGFPPWQNPFGGHQQMCYHRVLSKLPWFHLLPGKLYPWVMKLFGEPDSRIEDLMEIKETRITIEKFHRILKNEKYIIVKKNFWFINPNYEIKFKLKPRLLPNFAGSIPYLRNFLITTCYYIIKK